MIVTINTDASFNDEFCIGAYAFYIVSNQGKIIHSGPLKEAKNPQDAEAKCIANALYWLIQSKFTGVKKIIINSDAKYELAKIHATAKKGSPHQLAYGFLMELSAKHSLVGKFYELRHVKSHQKITTKRQWVNDWCDKAAKRVMREQVKKIKEAKDSQ